MRKVLLITLILATTIVYSQNKGKAVPKKLKESAWRDVKKGKDLLTTVLLNNVDVNEKNELVQGAYRVCSYVSIDSLGNGKHVMIKLLYPDSLEANFVYPIPNKFIKIYGDSFKIVNIKGIKKRVDIKHINRGLLTGFIKLHNKIGDTIELSLRADEAKESKDRIIFNLKKVNYKKAEYENQAEDLTDVEINKVIYPKQFKELQESGLDEHAEFPGGEKGFVEYMQMNLKYPQMAFETGIQGTVFAGYKINSEGKIEDIKILRGIGGGCDQEVIRTISLMPKWKPARIDSVALPVYKQLSIRFKLVDWRDKEGITGNLNSIEFSTDRTPDFVIEEDSNGVKIGHYKRSKLVVYKKIKINDEETKEINYYWNGIKQSETTYKGNIANGKQTLWRINGIKKFEGEYKDDKCVGEHCYYYDNGNIHKEIDYEKGIYREWGERGYITKEGRFKEGQAKGLWKEYADGILSAKGKYKDGFKKGRWVMYDDKGKKTGHKRYKEEEYANKIDIPTEFNHYSGGSMTYSVIGKILPLYILTETNELIKEKTNADVREKGIEGAETDINIRGGTHEHTGIVLDGIKMYDPQSGNNQKNMSCFRYFNKEIELLNSTDALKYGINSGNEVIKSVKYIDDNNLIFTAIGGENNYYNTGLVINTYGGLKTKGANTNKYLENSLIIDSRGSDGYGNNTGFNKNQINYNAEYSIYNKKTEIEKRTYFRFAGGYLDNRFGTHNFYSELYPDQYSDNKSSFINLQINKNYINNRSSRKNHDEYPDITAEANIFWIRNNNKYVMDRANPTNSFNSYNYSLSDAGGVTLETVIDRWNPVTIKAMLSRENIMSNILGDSTGRRKSIDGETGLYYDHRKSRNNTEFFIKKEYILKPKVDNTIKKGIFIIPALLVSRNDMYDWNLCPGLDIIYKNYEKDINYSIKINKTTRIPTFTELYENSPISRGNDILNPENLINYEAGIIKLREEYEQRCFYHEYLWRISIFRKDGSNIIDWVKKPADNRWECVNIEKLNITGIEASTKLDAKDILGKNYGILRNLNSISLDYTYISSNKSKGDYISYYVMTYLKHNIRVKLDYRLFKKINAVLTYTYHSRAGTYIDEPTGKEINYKPYNLLDGKIIYVRQSLNVYLELTNIFNSAYYDFGNMPLPGRWVKVGVMMNFNWDNKKENN